MKDFGVSAVTISGRDPCRVTFRLGDDPATGDEADQAEWVEISVLVNSPANPQLLNLQMQALRRAKELFDAYGDQLENAAGQR